MFTTSVIIKCVSCNGTKKDAVHFFRNHAMFGQIGGAEAKCDACYHRSSHVYGGIYHVTREIISKEDYITYKLVTLTLES